MSQVASELHWRQPRWNKRFWELDDNGGEIIATLEQPSVWKREYRAVFGNRVLTFRTVGFWQTKTVVRDETSGVDVAEYNRSFKSALAFKTGRVFRWQRRKFWKSVYAFTAADNEDVVLFKNESSVFRTGALVTPSLSASRYPELPVLLAFGFYLTLLAAGEAAGAEG